MNDDAIGFVGSIPENYDCGLGPIIFADYAEHTALLVAGYARGWDDGYRANRFTVDEVKTDPNAKPLSPECSNDGFGAGRAVPHAQPMRLVIDRLGDSYLIVSPPKEVPIRLKRSRPKAWAAAAIVHTGSAACRAMTLRV